MRILNLTRLGWRIVLAAVLCAPLGAQSINRATRSQVDSILRNANLEVRRWGVRAQLVEMEKSFHAASADTMESQMASAKATADSARRNMAVRFSSLRDRMPNQAARSALKSWYAYWDATWDVLDDSKSADRRYEELATLAKKVSVEF